MMAKPAIPGGVAKAQIVSDVMGVMSVTQNSRHHRKMAVCCTNNFTLQLLCKHIYFHGVNCSQISLPRSNVHK
jgi:hypothetical protein